MRCAQAAKGGSLTANAGSDSALAAAELMFQTSRGHRVKRLRCAPSVGGSFAKSHFGMGWDVGVRIGFFVTVAIGAIGLGAAPEAVSEPPLHLSGCGAGFYRNSDGDCIPDPSKSPASGLPADGTPGLVTAPGLVGGTGPGVATAPGFGGGTPGGPPPGATARCRDGDYSYSTHHSGTCSRHGGVSQWLAS
jgi:hypothetical protein